jgi:hypothetical protein
MGSTDRDIRDKQLKKAEGVFEARKARLTAEGFDAKKQSRDPVLRNLAADLRKAKARIAAIEKAAQHVRETAEKDVKVKKEDADKAKGKGKAAQGGGKPKKEKPEKPEKAKPEKAKPSAE